MLLKRFVDIKFDTNQWAIVPSSWGINNFQQCYWSNKGNLQQLAKNLTTADAKKWSRWNVQEICLSNGKCDLYLTQLIG